MVKQYTKGKAVQLSKNFKSTEFDCKCGRADCKITLIDLDGIECVQKARDLVGKAIVINSGYRCAAHNKSVGGVSSSKHLKGTAMDLKCPSGISLNDFAWICEQAGFKGVLRYDGQGFVHCDMRENVYRGVTTNGGKSFTEVETFNPNPPPKKVDITLPILKNGSKGDAVKTLQVLLNAKGYKGKNGKTLTVDGIFGANCDYAVENFRKDVKLTAGKIVDGDTWKKLLGV